MLTEGIVVERFGMTPEQLMPERPMLFDSDDSVWVLADVELASRRAFVAGLRIVRRENSSRVASVLLQYEGRTIDLLCPMERQRAGIRAMQAFPFRFRLVETPPFEMTGLAADRTALTGDDWSRPIGQIDLNH